MSKINNVYGMTKDKCVRKAKCLIVAQVLNDDGGVFFEIKDEQGKLRAIIEYRDIKGELRIVPLNAQLIERIRTKRIKTVYTEDDIRHPELQADYISNLVCGCSSR